MPRYRVLPYKPGSKGAKALAEGLGCLRLKVRNSRFRPRDTDVIINWGYGAVPERLRGARILNPPHKINRVSDKLRYFELMQRKASDYIPPFWTSKDDIPEDAYPIVARTILNGHSGQGIEIADEPDDLVDAPLYVQYINKQHEYRIHVAGGEVIATQRKARRRSVPDGQVNWRIRNSENGFVFARNDGTEYPQVALDAAIAAVAAAELDFGAVDVIYNSNTERAYAIEVNSAPGIEGSTVDDYVRYFTGA